MDEVAVGAVKDRLEQLQELDARREAIISSIEKQGKLTVDLMSSIVSAETLAQRHRPAPASSLATHVRRSAIEHARQEPKDEPKVEGRRALQSEVQDGAIRKTPSATMTIEVRIPAWLGFSP